MIFTPYDGNQIRQLVNSEQLYDALTNSERKFNDSYRGSMSWKKVSGREYLYRKRRTDWRSLGPRSSQTEHAYRQFQSGRSALKQKIGVLEDQLQQAARVNRAMNLGRVPFVAARLVRRLADKGLLGTRVLIVGTPALFVYERLAGGQLNALYLATEDLDLLLDARHELKLLADEQDQGLIGMLREIDESFELVGPNAFRAANSSGYMIDLITPLPRQPATASPAGIGQGSEDLVAAEMEGLDWLQSAPRIEQVVIDEKGFPLTLVVPDPRHFALHKLWVSKQASRDRMKARRDLAQALAVAVLVRDYLPHLPFDGAELGVFPPAVRKLVPTLLRDAPSSSSKTVWR